MRTNLKTAAIVFTLVACCARGLAAAPAPAEPATRPAAADAQFVLPAQDAVDTLRLKENEGFLSVDGHRTTVHWPRVAPFAFPIGQTRWFLLDDRNNGPSHLYLWDTKASAIVDLGDFLRLMQVGRRWNAIVRDGAYSGSPPGFAIYDLEGLDTASPHLRVRYREEASPPAAYGHPAGIVNGDLVFLMYRQAAGDRNERTTSLLRLSPKGEKRDSPIDLHDMLPVSTSDALRGDRLLLSGSTRKGNENEPGKGMHPFEVRLAVLDVISGSLGELGNVPGYWDVTLNLPAPRVSIEWATVAEAAAAIAAPKQRQGSFLDVPQNLVIEGTEKVVTIRPQPLRPDEPKH